MKAAALAACLSLVAAAVAASPASAQAILDTTATTVAFDDLILSGPEPGCGYAGFHALTASNARVQGSPAYTATAVTAGVTTPQTYSGSLDSNGSATLYYCPPPAVVVDPVEVTFTATVGAATGVAVRSWDVDGIDGSCSSAPCTTTAATVTFDDTVITGGSPGCGYIGFYANHAGGGRVQGNPSYTATATTTAAATPQTYSGSLDSNGRAVFYYCPPSSPVSPVEVTLTATVGAATGTATRVWDPQAVDDPCQTVSCEPPPVDDPCQTVSCEPPSAGPLQVWNINIEKLNKDWTGFAQRVAAAEAVPDIITVQEIDQGGPLEALRSAIDDAIDGPDYRAETGGDGRNAVIWNDSRLKMNGQPHIWPHAWCDGGNVANAIAVDLRERSSSSTHNVVAASIHPSPRLSTSCLSDILTKANNQLDIFRTHRALTVLGGDFNERPDNRVVDQSEGPAVAAAQALAGGLETDPACWYRRMTPAQFDWTLAGDDCGTSSLRRYYDAVWSAPNTGGGTNPTSPAFCEQFTFQNHWDFSNGYLQETATSCTPPVVLEQLDPSLAPLIARRSRIDYIWTSYEDTAGTPWLPPPATVASLIPFASADLGMSFNNPEAGDPTIYSDHRGVQALLAWPVIPAATVET